MLLITVGLIGGCTGSTSCSVKVFRYLVLFQAVRAQLRRRGARLALAADTAKEAKKSVIELVSSS